ncbi:MAG: hypothetical protein IH939_12315, partial [Acidobacteria bacterium]|nr:hypothetical protein [Acidobacteriota bacterium]
MATGTIPLAAMQLQATDPWYSIVNRDDNWLGLEYGNKEWNENNYTHRWTYTGAVSYVTGSHSFKFGGMMSKGRNRYSYDGNGNLYQVYTGQPDPFGRILDFVGPDHFAAANNVKAGLPSGLTGLADEVVVTNHPSNVIADLSYNGGFYAQDSWTLDRLTLNYGLRVDLADTAIPAVVKPGGRFSPAILYDRIELPNLGPDFSPRLSVAYDLFGNAKTALKFGYNKYVRNVGGNFPQRYAPALQDTDRRDWFDVHLLPDGSGPSGLNPYGTNGDDIAQDWEIGPTGNINFGLRETDRPDPNIQREYNILYTVGIQQELRPGLSISAEFRRRSYHDTTSGDNLFRNFANFGVLPNGSIDPNASAANSFQFLRPAPYVGVVTIFNIDPSVRTLVDELDRTRGPGYSNVYYGFELSLNARLPNGGTIFGGWTLEDASAYGGEVNQCQDVLDRGDNPNALRFCDSGSFPRPLRSEFKLSGTYPFSPPFVGQLQVGASLLAYPGGAGWRGMGESFFLSRSGFLQAIRHKLSAYVAPFYTEANCVAPCVLGGVIAPRGEFPTYGTSTGSFTVPL